jgi:ParB family transcriptional regulator, chromosome partitioning protein
MSRRDELIAKAAGIRAASEISDTEVQATVHVPRSGQGSYSRRQALEDRLAMLEKFGGDLLRIETIAPNPWQPRKVFNDEEIQKLAESITAVGLIQPIVVRKSVASRYTPGGQGGDTEGRMESVATRYTYELVSGERRLRAHRLLGLPEIKAVVADVSDEDMALMALAENISRQDLTAYEISKAIRAVQDRFTTSTRLAESIGIHRTDLYKYLAFADLPDFVVADLELSPGLLGRDAARDLASLVKKRGTGASEAIANSWSKVKAGHLDQGRLASAIESLIDKHPAVPAERDIRKLFVGKAQAGSITRDAATLTVKIRAAALTPEKEAELRSFVETLLIR